MKTFIETQQEEARKHLHGYIANGQEGTILDEAEILLTPERLDSLISQVVQNTLSEVEKKLLKKGSVFDTKVFAIPYARQKYEEIVKEITSDKK